MGKRVKTLREDRDLTLKALAARSGVAVSTISKIERGLMAPTYDRLTGLAHGLGVDIAELFSTGGTAFEAGTVEVARAGDFGHLETESYAYNMLFTNIRSKAMTPALGTLKPLEEADLGDLVRHSGEEFLMVLQGTVLVRLEGRDEVVLAAGDSLYLDSRRGHLYAAAGEEEARILIVGTSPGTESEQAG